MMKKGFTLIRTLLRKNLISVQQGFTLIELLVVISIIGVLIGLSVFGLQGARQSSRDARRKADLELIRGGLEIYKADCNGYPDSITPGQPLVGTGAAGTPCSSDNTYITKVPEDPIPATNGYSYTTVGVKYYLCAALEQIPSPTPADLSNCAGCGDASCNYIVTNP